MELSGGQKQRLAIAKDGLKNAGIWLSCHPAFCNSDIRYYR